MILIRVLVLRKFDVTDKIASDAKAEMKRVVAI